MGATIHVCAEKIGIPLCLEKSINWGRRCRGKSYSGNWMKFYALI